MLIMIRSLTVTDLNSCAPEVMVPDVRVFSSIKNEQKYPWLYDSMVHQGYLCKFCELYCGHSSSSQECVTVGINLGTVWSLDIYYWTSKLMNLLLFPTFPNSHHLCANFPNDKGPGPQIQISWKITGIKGGNTRDVLCFLIWCHVIYVNLYLIH
jgi:hypothetical protein